ncbi:MAG: phosphatase PAP2 family protein [Candidatus Pacearchaeota archaeon]
MRKQVIWLILVSVLMTIFLFFDYQLLLLIDLIKFSALNSFFSVLLFIQSEPYYEIWLLLFMLILMLTIKEKNRFPKFMLAFAVAAFVNLALKNIFSRPRPIGGLESGQGKSFPSGHSTLIFTTLPFLEKKTIKFIWTIFTFLLVFARVYFKIHFLSDIAAGFILGYGSAFLFKELNLKRTKKDAR